MRKLLPSLLLALLTPFAPAQDKAELGKLKEAASAAVEKQDWPAAAASFRKICELQPDNGQAWHMLGFALHSAGKLDEALPVHEKAASFPQTRGIPAYNVACVHALKGNKDKAFEWLGKAVEQGFANVDHIDHDTDMDSLRADPRFKAICEKMAAVDQTGGQLVAYAPQTERLSARYALFNQRGSPGQFAIDFGTVKWKDSYDETANSAKFHNRHWRFGTDFWTTLDSSLDVKFGDVAVPAGYYYLTLQRSPEGNFTLFCHDAAAVRKLKMDAYVADKLTGGIAVPLTHSAAEEKAERLDIRCKAEANKPGCGTLLIRFGGHQLSVPFVAAVGK